MRHQLMQRTLRNITTMSEPLLGIHLSVDKTAARDGSGFHVEQHPPENVRVARENVRGASFTKAIATPLPQPKLVVVSPTALRLIQEPAPNENEPLSADAKKVLTDVIAGTGPIEGLAHCYAGHQFGHFSGQLGDGAAILLGGTGKWEAQLKGAGLTAFSRTADGRKVLRSTLREFLASEHMHALNIPTTRAGGVAVSSTETALRDVFYDGNAQHEPCATVLRIAQTFVRFGSFELFKPVDSITGRAGPSSTLPLDAQRATLRAMLAFVQREYYDIHAESDDLEEPTRRFLQAVTQRTAALVAKWQTVGFCHGVLNTDNMSIVGDTLDYGPYGFMEYFDPGHICNTSDNSGRYAYENQPKICKWNCHMLVSQFALLFPDNVLDDLHALVDATYDATYAEELRCLMDRKLGLPPHDTDANAALVASFWTTLTDTHADFTCVFRALSGLSVFEDATVESVLQALVKVSHSLAQAQRAAQPSVSPAQLAHLQQLLVSKPNVALRYGFDQDTLDGLAKQLTDYAAFLEADLTAEGFKQMQENRWRVWLEQYRQHLAKHTADAQADVARRQAMDLVNPKFILRNHVAQAAIDAASSGDYATVAHILHLLTHPFEDGVSSCDVAIYGQPSDPTAPPLLVSCSS